MFAPGADGRPDPGVVCGFVLGEGDPDAVGLISAGMASG